MMRIISVQSLFWKLVTQTIYRLQFYHIGKKSRIICPLKIDNRQTIELGENVYIGHYGWLMGAENGRSLTIGSGSVIGHFSHIIAMSSVCIEEKVLIADRVFITDCTHNYSDTSKAIMDQGIKCINSVVVGEGSWLGENVCIIGAKVGKHCVIGANSVVTDDIPDYSVAVGTPARVIRKIKS